MAFVCPGVSALARRAKNGNVSSPSCPSTRQRPCCGGSDSPRNPRHGNRSQNQMEPAPSRRESWVFALCVLTQRNALSIELRECVGERTCCVASVCRLTGKSPKPVA